LISVTTPPVYRPGVQYTLIAAPLGAGEARRTTVAAGADGRLKFEVDGLGRQVSITGPGAGAQLPVLLPVGRGEGLRVMPGIETALPVRIHNPRTEAIKDVVVELESDYPTVELLKKSTTVPVIAAGASVDLSGAFKARFTAGSGDYAPARIRVKMAAGWPGSADHFDVMIAPDALAAPVAVEVLDGRTMKFTMFRQKGNQGGGSAIERTVTEGKGNGNGVLEPGEEATIWVKLAQGLDPFDKGNWHRTRVFTDSPWIEEIGRFEELKQREWTGANELTSLIRLSMRTPAGTAIPLVLSNESWSFHFTPDVRYGVEPLYQAIQLHQSHIYKVEIRTGGR
jgi:hypothetical protein